VLKCYLILIFREQDRVVKNDVYESGAERVNNKMMNTYIYYVYHNGSLQGAPELKRLGAIMQGPKYKE
jgi:hypothetical protein